MAYTLFLEDGYRQGERGRSLPRLCSEAISDAILGLMRWQVVEGRTERMLEILPEAAYVALAPFIGPAGGDRAGGEQGRRRGRGSDRLSHRPGAVARSRPWAVSRIERTLSRISAGRLKRAAGGPGFRRRSWPRVPRSRRAIPARRGGAAASGCWPGPRPPDRRRWRPLTWLNERRMPSRTGSAITSSHLAVLGASAHRRFPHLYPPAFMNNTGLRAGPTADGKSPAKTNTKLHVYFPCMGMYTGLNAHSQAISESPTRCSF